MSDNTLEKYQKIMEDARAFMLENEQEFEKTCDELATIVDGKNLAVGILSLQTVLGSLILCDTDREDVLYRVIVLLHAQIKNAKSQFEAVDKDRLN